MPWSRSPLARSAALTSTSYHGHIPSARGAARTRVRRSGRGGRIGGPALQARRSGGISFYTSCGHCALCRKGWFNQCEHKETFGFGEAIRRQLGGGQAEYVVVPHADHTMEPIPAAMSDEQAIFVGDILATGMFARRARRDQAWRRRWR